MIGRAVTEYEQRKASVDVDAAEAVFDRHFALASFRQAMPPDIPLSRDTMDRIRRGGQLDLAVCCLTYVFVIENAPTKPEHAAFLKCIGRIRDAAKEMAEAADFLAVQAVRHRRQTGIPERLREGALERLAHALHNRCRVTDSDNINTSVRQLQPINNPFSGNRVTNGLSDCGLVFNEAESIIKDYRNSVGGQRSSGTLGSGMRAGNRSNYERQAFLRDLAVIYQQVIAKIPSAPNDDNRDSPFVRFVHHVFDEIANLDLVLLDRNAVRRPSKHVIRAALENRGNP